MEEYIYRPYLKPILCLIEEREEIKKGYSTYKPTGVLIDEGWEYKLVKEGEK